MSDEIKEVTEGTTEETTKETTDVKDDVKENDVETTEETNPAVDAVADVLAGRKESEKTAEEKQEDTKPDSEAEEEDEDKSTPEGEEPEKKDDSKTTPDTAKEVGKLNLPTRLLQAAKRNHLSDQEVLDLGDKAEVVLSRLADNSDRVSAELGELGRKAKELVLLSPKKEVKQTTLDIKVNEDDPDEVKELKTSLKALTEEISGLKKQFTDKDGESTRMSLLERDRKIDSFLDGKTGDFSELGNSKDLSTAQLAVRKTIFGLADDIMTGASVRGQNVSLEDALESAFSIYESKTPKKKVTREKVLKEVEDRERSLIHRPSHKKGVAQPTDPRKKQIDAVKDVLNRGREGW
jgi:HAMP domain-containing protein